MGTQYETVIGLEVHVELATQTKIFCGCSTKFGGKPNTHICPVCTGQPGSLPVLNKKVVEYAMAVGLATNCAITRDFCFDRKNYFYPDNPQNYQISQLYQPICQNGYVKIEGSFGKKKVRIHEIHMEEDAGKLIHDEIEEVSYVDYNRSGVPLIEIVSEPDMRSGEEVVAYLEKLRMLIQYLGASDCKLNEGSMRADVNLSLRPVGSKAFGTRTEMKNLNSFKAIMHAIEGETNRQMDLLEEGKEVQQETRRWDDTKGMSYSMRSKEDAKDYRYFPDPDIPPVHISEEWVQEMKERQPEFQEAKKVRYMETFGLPEYDASILTSVKKLADYFEEAVSLGATPKKVSNWLMGETLRLQNAKEKDADYLPVSPSHLVELISIVEEGLITGTIAKEIYEKMFESDFAPKAYVEEQGLAMVSDDGALQEVVKQVLEQNPKSVEDYRNGKEKAIGFLVGQTMKAMQGKANPGKVNELLKEMLSK